ncbi:MAG: hypothetical protein GX175_05320 [Halanaerobiaceae bacterium]|nr:hypothetical protein [Halanaerobiaceae bacterium]
MLKDFDLASVQVTAPYFANAFEKVTQYLLSLDPDRFLAGFRAVSEGKDPGTEKGLELYGGWEDSWSLLRGHTMGHYLTALAQAYRQTRKNNQELNERLAERINYTVSQLKACQDHSPGGYLFASPETHFDVVEGKSTGNQWVPWYTIHKILSGLINVYKYTGNQEALEVAARLGDWACERTSSWDDELQKRVLAVEYGGINDVLYELYKYTNKTEHLAAAHKFDEDALFMAILEGKDVLVNKHANTQIPKFIGALNRYCVTGEGFYYQAARAFWEMVVRVHTYVTGGNSQSEHFRQPGLLDATRDNLNNETCNAYNMLLLTRGLFRLTGDVRYADFYERAFINEIMASINPETGMTTYFKPMGTGYFKAFGTPTESFWCCTGTGMENFTRLNDSIYFHKDDDLYVNLYISSRLDWEEKGLLLTQQSDIPETDTVLFTVDKAPAEKLSFRFRVPEWLAEGQEMKVKINGEEFSAEDIDGYLTVSRDWQDGDRLELHLPLEVKVSRLPDNRNAVAFSYGPVVLCTSFGAEEMVIEPHWASVKAVIPYGKDFKDYIVIQNGTVDDWLANIENNLIKTPGKLEFTLRGTDEDDNFIFKPYYLEYKERYGIYFYLQTPDSPALKEILESRERAGRLVEATIDVVQIINDQYEAAHNLRGNSSGGYHEGYNFRQAYGTTDGEGWFSYDLAVNPEVNNYLCLKYYSGDADRGFNIYIDDRLFVEESIQARTPEGFYDVQYEIPAEWIKGKNKITVKFANRGPGYAGRIFDKVLVMKDLEE